MVCDSLISNNGVMDAIFLNFTESMDEYPRAYANDI